MSTHRESDPPVFGRHLALLRAAQQEIARLLEAPPVRPAGLDLLLTQAAQHLTAQPPNLPLAQATRELRRLLYAAPGHERQCELLWREALITAMFAARVASAAGHVEPQNAGAAGLLHRAGDALALRAIGIAEREQGAVLDAGHRSRVLAGAQRDLAGALMRAWAVPPDIAAAVLGWQTLGAVGAPNRTVTAVYFGHLLAAEHLYPQLGAPGLADALGADCGIDAARLEEIRVQGAEAREFMLALG